MNKPQKYVEPFDNVIPISSFSGEREKLGARMVSWISEQVGLQRGRFFYWMPVFLSFGIGFYFLIPAEPPMILLGFGLLLSLAILTLLPKDRAYIRLAVITCLLCPAIGLVAAKAQLSRVHTLILTEEIGPITIEGRVESLEILKKDYDARLVLSNIKAEGLEDKATPKLVRLRLRKDYDIKVGQRISALAQLLPPSEPVMPGGFDFRRHLYFESIGAVGFIYNNVQVLENNTHQSSLSQSIEKARSFVSDRAHAALPDKTATIATALINGQRAGIDEEDREALRGAGLAHLLAISGLHLGLVCGALFFAIRLGLVSLGSLALHYPVKKYAAIFALVGGFAYMLLAGSTIPTQRALLMSAVVFGAILIDRSAISLRLVAFAALVVLIISPYSLLTASFQLSFAAVTALVAFYDWLRPYMSDWYRQAGWVQKTALYFAGVATTSLIAGLATAPFALYHFQAFAAYGLLANMVAIPVMAFWVMPMAIIALITIPFGFEYYPFFLMGHGIEWIKDIAYFVSDLEGAVLRLPIFSFSIFFFMVMGLLFFVLLKGQIRFIGIIIFICTLPFIYIQKQPSILISSTFDLVLMNGDGEQIKVNNLRREKFIRENWERSLGLKENSAKLWSSKNGDLCDDQGCRAIINNTKIAYSTSQYGLNNDCGWANLVISENPIFGNCSAKNIDFFDVHRWGAHSIYLNKSAINIKTVEEELLIKRPWTGSLLARREN